MKKYSNVVVWKSVEIIWQFLGTDPGPVFLIYPSKRQPLILIRDDPLSQWEWAATLCNEGIAISNQMDVIAINHYPMSVMSQTERENFNPMAAGR